ncbi:MAG: hypothetical protein LQ352_006509 [Teloschistes flavicans]|nr:MAG: hypothetical protein LQ352_006509 [Teloschistes flavicans]
MVGLDSKTDTPFQRSFPGRHSATISREKTPASVVQILGCPGIAESELETILPSLVASAHGTVLEIGPGTGNQLPRYDRSKITKIYGIEPCIDLHPALREAVKKAGLSDVYTIVPCGMEDVAGLKRFGVDQETFDCALTCQVLCSVPSPGAVASAMWRLLKPGGEMIVYEHVRSKDILTLGVQKIYQLVWPYVIGGCCMDRDIATTLRQAGEWAKVDLQLPTKADAFEILPRISGRLIKAS